MSEAIGPVSDPVAEELLEKGARAAWDSDSSMVSWDQVPPKLQAGYKAQVSAAFDAVFPGWREGITRELAWHDERNGFLRRSPHDLLATESLCGNHDVVVQRWLGPWVPVEKGTT